MQADAETALFFIPSTREGHAMFDLAGFIRMRLENAGVLMIDDIGADTYSDERFLQLPPLGASRGAGLRPPRACDRTRSRIVVEKRYSRECSHELAPGMTAAPKSAVLLIAAKNAEQPALDLNAF